MMQRSLIIGLISALLLVVFALKNSTQVEIDFIIGNPVKGSFSLILLVTLIIGIFVGLLLSFPGIQKFKKKLSEDKKEITKLNNILEEYKKESLLHKKKESEKHEDNS